MDFAEAGRTYTLLTVGDGLVTQIPALIVSTAAGMLVSKAGEVLSRGRARPRTTSPGGYAYGANPGRMELNFNGLPAVMFPTTGTIVT